MKNIKSKIIIGLISVVLIGGFGLITYLALTLKDLRVPLITPYRVI